MARVNNLNYKMLHTKNEHTMNEQKERFCWKI